jgi:hypothetical protein
MKYCNKKDWLSTALPETPQENFLFIFICHGRLKILQCGQKSQRRKKQRCSESWANDFGVGTAGKGEGDSPGDARERPGSHRASLSGAPRRNIMKKHKEKCFSSP